MKTEHIELLKASGFFNELSQEQFDRLVTKLLVTYEEYKKNDILFWANEPPEKLYILINGDIALGKDTANGKRNLSKNVTRPGTLLNEIQIFSPKTILSEYTIALKDSAVFTISREIFFDNNLIDSDIQILLLRNMIKSIIEKVDYMGKKISVLAAASVRECIAFYLLEIQDENNQIILRLTREEIADYLGIARPSLSRELTRMQDDGIIRIDGHEVFILDQKFFNGIFT